MDLLGHRNPVAGCFIMLVIYQPEVTLQAQPMQEEIPRMHEHGLRIQQRIGDKAMSWFVAGRWKLMGRKFFIVLDR